MKHDSTRRLAVNSNSGFISLVALFLVVALGAAVTAAVNGGTPHFEKSVSDASAPKTGLKRATEQALMHADFDRALTAAKARGTDADWTAVCDSTRLVKRAGGTLTALEAHAHSECEATNE